MDNILIMTDSASDITAQIEENLKLKVINIPITINGEGYMDRESFTPMEFYKILNETSELPTTAHITPHVFCEEFHNAYNQGYTDIIYVSINATGSATFEASQKGKNLLFEEFPELKGNLNIHLLSSMTYSMGYGIPVLIAAKMADRGEYTALQIVEKLEQLLVKTDLCFSMYTLKFAKKSGRLSTLSAFVGEMLGIRPLVLFRNGKSVIYGKVRGDKNIVPALVDYYLKNTSSDDYFIICGEDDAPAQELEQALFDKTGKKAHMIIKEGACISINAGPHALAVVFFSKNKNEK